MNKGINLYSITRITDFDLFRSTDRIISNRDSMISIQIHEQKSLMTFVNKLIDQNLKIDQLDNFFLSYKLPQLGKEFDLLKINSHGVLCVELKSQIAEERKVLKQLQKDKYYLSVLKPRALYLYGFIEETNCIYKYENGNLVISSEYELIKAIKDVSIDSYCEIDGLFRPSQFLVSPLNTPDKFIANEYYLTSRQEEIKKDIIADAQLTESRFHCITGNAGTGKTLLLYDLAKCLSDNNRCLIIHCGKIPQETHIITDNYPNIMICTPKESLEFDLSMFNYIFIDEAQRLYKNQFNIIVDKANDLHINMYFCCDENQVLSIKEQQADIQGTIKSLPSCKIYRLTDKVRTNKELAHFIDCMFNLNKPYNFYYDGAINICYANDSFEAHELIKYYQQSGYYFINFSQSNYHGGPYKQFYEQDSDSHHVIGQEFDNVLIVIDSSFKYNEKKQLTSVIHPNPDYQYLKLLYQGVTRVRERLCIIIVSNIDAYKNMISIFQPVD